MSLVSDPRTPGTFMHSPYSTGRVGIGVGDSTLMRPCFGPQDACTYVHAYVSLREPYTQLYYAPGRSVCSRVGHALHRHGHGWAWTWTRARPFTRYRRRTRSAAGRTGTSSVPRSTLWPACWRRTAPVARSAQRRPCPPSTRPTHLRIPTRHCHCINHHLSIMPTYELCCCLNKIVEPVIRSPTLLPIPSR